MTIPVVQLEEQFLFAVSSGDFKGVRQHLPDFLKSLSRLDPDDCDLSKLKTYRDALQRVSDSKDLPEHKRSAIMSVLSWISQFHVPASDEKKRPIAIDEVLKQQALQPRHLTPSFQLHRKLDASIQTLSGEKCAGKVLSTFPGKR